MTSSASRKILYQPEGRVLAFPACPTSSRIMPGPEALDDAQRIELDRLRWLALRSRLAPKPNLEEACFLLAAGREASLERYSVCFFRGLADHARRDMVIYRPGARAVSDDESWLLRLMAAWRRHEPRAASALVAWRVEPTHQRWMRFLSEGLSASMDA